MTNKPFSPPSERNKEPILAVLNAQFAAPGLVLEIGSGTGQHAVFFANELPHLQWQPSDLAEHLPGIEAWRAEAGLPNVLPPLTLNVTTWPWPLTHCDYVFSANTAHIMAWPEVSAMLQGIGKVLAQGGLFALYGPFMRDGQHTAQSNARFDLSLRQMHPTMGVRDRADLNALASQHGLSQLGEFSLPANNEILLWRKA